MPSQRILIVGPSWVGDMVMAQALFKSLKQQDPNCQIDVLAPAWTFSLLSCMPEVTDAIAMPFGHGELNLKGRSRLAKTLRKKEYTLAIVLPNSFKSALIPWLARIPKRRGWLGEQRYFLLNDYRRLDKKRYPLMVEQYLALGLPADVPLAKPYVYPAFHVTENERQQTLNKHNPIFRNRPVLALAPGGEFGSSKRWPPEYFAEIAQTKLAEGWDIWLFGSAKDKTLTEAIMYLTENRCENLAGSTTLAESIALLSLVNGLITNDSGLMHIGAALSKPIVAIYGSTSPAFTPPLAKEAVILQLSLPCQPCFERECPLKHHACMRDLKPAQVLSFIHEWG